MGSETTRFVSQLETSSRNNTLTADLQSISDEISKNRDSDAASKLLDEVLTDAQRRGLMPALARSYASANFRDLDLNGDGYIGAGELQQITSSALLAPSTNPLEKAILRYMNANVKEMAAAHNDILGGSQRISQKDLTAFEEQSRQRHEKANLAGSMKALFGTAESFAKLGPDRNGRVSEAQLNSNIRSGRFSEEEVTVMRAMVKHKAELVKMSNDEWGFESKVTLNDITKFCEKYTVPGLSTGLTVAKDFNKAVPAEVLDSAKHALPDVILDFGKRNFPALDHDGNGYLSRDEIKKLLQSTKWSRSLGPESTLVLKEMDSKLEQIANSSRDEWWYKDRKGITVKDLENYAEHQRRNRGDIPTTPGDHRLTLTIGGINREYLVHVPPGYDGKKELPVMYFYHYFTGNGDKLADYTGMNEKADKENFIVVYPRAEGWIAGAVRQWNLNNKPSNRVDEMAFVKQLMDHVEEKLKVDKSRQYVVGYSNGGMLAHEIAAKMPERIAGMVSIGGCQTGKEKQPASAVPVMMLNGTEDWLVPYNGRRFTPLFPRMQPTSSAVDFWRRANGTDGYSDTRLAPHVRQETYSSSRTGADVVMVTMQGSGHGYPGSVSSIDGNLCREINATDVAWNFLKDKRRSTSWDRDYEYSTNTPGSIVMQSHEQIKRMLNSLKPLMAR